MGDTRAMKRAVLSHTLPIMAGCLFLGTAYGMFMRTQGFPWFYPTLTSLTVFAGAMEFVLVNLLLGAFDPLGAYLLALLVNARHLFYGLAMLERYRVPGLKKLYPVFGLAACTSGLHFSGTNTPAFVEKNEFLHLLKFVSPGAIISRSLSR